MAHLFKNVLLLFVLGSITQIDAMLSEKQLRLHLKQIVNESEIATALWGICAKELNTGKTLIGYNAQKIFVPASNIKLWTTAAVLERLPQNFKFRTSVYTTSPIQDGCVKGDVVLFGRGDPTLNTRGLHHLALQMKKRGIKSIEGNVIACESYFDGPRVQPALEVMDVPMGYAGEISALTVNNNTFSITVIPSSVGQPARIMIDDSVNAIVKNKTETIDGDVCAIGLLRDLGSNMIEAIGKIGINAKPITRERAIYEAPTYAARLFKKMLDEEGIRVNGDIVIGSCQEHDAKELAFVESSELWEVIYTMNRTSHNLTAELLLHTVGKSKQTGGKTTRERGLTALNDLASRICALPNSYSFNCGSGLSKHSLLSPESMVMLLHYVSKTPYKDVFYSSLPVAGAEGTLKFRFLNNEKRNIHAKTGTMGKVSTLSGYATTVSGSNIVFSIFVNNHIVSPTVARKTIDTVLLKLLESA